jgi:hypothetical protein
MNVIIIDVYFKENALNKKYFFYYGGITMRPVTAFVFVILFFCIQPVFSVDSIGKIDYIHGNVEIVRDGDVLTSSDLTEGNAIENYDLIKTSANGEITIVITSPLSPQTQISIDPNTSFSIEINKISKKNSTNINMLAGNIALKVQHLTGSQEVNVKSEGSVCGVRGTSFGVGASPGGDVLITCNEGDVEVSGTDTGKKYHAIPGKAIEQPVGGVFKEIPVAVTNLAKFKQQWIAEKVEAFKANPSLAYKNFAVRYEKLVDKFDAAYGDLMKKNEVLDRWVKENKENKIGGKMELMRDKKAVIRDLLKIRGILFIFEKVYYRLLELHYYFKQGIGTSVMISETESAKTFFAKFEKEQMTLGKKTATVKFIVKLYAKRNDNSFPTDETDTDSNEDDNFFND